MVARRDLCNHTCAKNIVHCIYMYANYTTHNET